MLRRTKIVLAITLMVAALVSFASCIYISGLLSRRINWAQENANHLALNLVSLATNEAPDLSSTRVDTSNPEAVRREIAYYLGTDRVLNNFLESIVGNWPDILD